MDDVGVGVQERGEVYGFWKDLKLGQTGSAHGGGVNRKESGMTEDSDWSNQPKDEAAAAEVETGQEQVWGMVWHSTARGVSEPREPSTWRHQGVRTRSLELRSGPTRDRTVGVIRVQMTLEPQEWTRLPGKRVGWGGRQSPSPAEWHAQVTGQRSISRFPLHAPCKGGTCSVQISGDSCTL